jgi:outer membrane receptor protein involved in Fe transport
VRRKWGNSYFLNLRINSSFTANQLPEELKNEVTKNIFNVRSSLSQRVAVCKQANIVLTTEWFDNNIFTPQQISFLFMDAEFNFVLPSKHVSFIIRFQNITDQRFYRSFDIQPPNYQNFFTIPLVRRNAFVSVRYEL